MMLQQDYPDDFVLGIGESHTVRDFVQATFNEIKIELEWIGSGLNEVGYQMERQWLKSVRNFTGL